MALFYHLFHSLIGDFGLSQIIAIFLGLIIAWYFYMTKEYRKWEKTGVPSIKPSFIFGNLKDVVLQKQHTLDFHREFYNKMAGHR